MGLRIFLVYVLSGVLLALPSYANSPPESLPALDKQSSHKFKVQLTSPYLEVKKAESFPIGIQIKLPAGWHTYWSFAGDFGEAPRLKWKDIKNVSIKGRPFPTPKRKSSRIGKKVFHSFIYEEGVLIPFEVFIDKDFEKNHLDLSLDLEWFVCKDVCFSKTEKLNLHLAVGEDFKTQKEKKTLFDFWKLFSPKPLSLKSHFETKDKNQILHFSFEKEISCLDIFPLESTDFSSRFPKLLNQSSKSCSFQVKKSSSNLSKISGLLVYSRDGEKHSSLFQSYKQKKLGLLWFIFMAFLGGLILNIMPCVLPIIFLKFYNTLELKHLASGKILLLNLSYAAGVILSFLLLALFVFISKQTGESLGWGFHLQSPVFVTFLALLFTMMGLYLLNVVSFSTPKVSLIFKEEKLFSHFLTGVLSTTAASPCTVPFMASAVGFAFSRSYVEIFSIFFFLGLGLSSPYLLLSFFPSALKYVPGPGRKTEILKKLLSIPLFLTVIWLFTVLYMQMDLKVFFFSLTVFPFLLLWLLFHKTIQKPMARYIVNFTFIVLAIVFFIEQKAFHDFFKKSKDSFKNQKSIFQKAGWLFFNEESLIFDKQNGKNIFVAFGAEWCLTCKFNERIFNAKEFLNLVKEKQIHLYYGDWTNSDPEITRFLEKYNHQGVPFYIFFKGEEKLFIFPSLLTKESFLQDLDRLSD